MSSQIGSRRRVIGTQLALSLVASLVVMAALPASASGQGISPEDELRAAGLISADEGWLCGGTGQATNDRCLGDLAGYVGSEQSGNVTWGSRRGYGERTFEFEGDGNCTHYAAWRVKRDGGISFFDDSDEYLSGAESTTAGHAKYWDHYATSGSVRAGIVATPERGDIAQWDGAGYSNHVAYVEYVGFVDGEFAWFATSESQYFGGKGGAKRAIYYRGETIFDNATFISVDYYEGATGPSPLIGQAAEVVSPEIARGIAFRAEQERIAAEEAARVAREIAESNALAEGYAEAQRLADEAYADLQLKWAAEAEAKAVLERELAERRAEIMAENSAIMAAAAAQAQADADAEAEARALAAKAEFDAKKQAADNAYAEAMMRISQVQNAKAVTAAQSVQILALDEYYRQTVIEHRALTEYIAQLIPTLQQRRQELLVAEGRARDFVADYDAAQKAKAEFGSDLSVALGVMELALAAATTKATTHMSQVEIAARTMIAAEETAVYRAQQEANALSAYNSANSTYLYYKGLRDNAQVAKDSAWAALQAAEANYQYMLTLTLNDGGYAVGQARLARDNAQLTYDNSLSTYNTYVGATSTSYTSRQNKLQAYNTAKAYSDQADSALAAAEQAFLNAQQAEFGASQEKAILQRATDRLKSDFDPTGGMIKYLTDLAAAKAAALAAEAAAAQAEQAAAAAAAQKPAKEAEAAAIAGAGTQARGDRQAILDQIAAQIAGLFAETNTLMDQASELQAGAQAELVKAESAVARAAMFAEATELAVPAFERAKSQRSEVEDVVSAMQQAHDEVLEMVNDPGSFMTAEGAELTRHEAETLVAYQAERLADAIESRQAAEAAAQEASDADELARELLAEMEAHAAAIADAQAAETLVVSLSAATAADALAARVAADAASARAQVIANGAGDNAALAATLASVAQAAAAQAATAAAEGQAAAGDASARVAEAIAAPTSVEARIASDAAMADVTIATNAAAMAANAVVVARDSQARNNAFLAYRILTTGGSGTWWGTNHWKRLEQAIGLPMAGSNFGRSSAFTTYGTYSAQARTFQSYLNANDGGRTSDIPTDGYWGPQTTEKLRAVINYRCGSSMNSSGAIDGYTGSTRWVFNDDEARELAICLNNNRF